MSGRHASRWMAAVALCAGAGAAPAQELERPAAAPATPAAATPAATVRQDRLAEYRRVEPDLRSPIPSLQVTRETYYKWLQFSGHFSYVRQAAVQGQYGPRHFLPVLVRFVHTGDATYADACLEMLRRYDAWLRDTVAKNGWHVAFCQEPGYIGLYQHVLSRAGRLTPADKTMLRELFLFMARNIHAWDTPETFWRGPMHRAQGEGVLRGLAAAWYPDIPEAAEWSSYAAQVYGDWWQFRDLAPNDTNYFLATLQSLVLRAVLWDDDAFFTDPGMQPLWERLREEVSPDGSLPPYGAHWGWNQGAGVRIAVLEAIATRTRDGRYRYAAHRMMNYLVYQRENYRRHHMLLGPDTTEPIALAYLWADDGLEPVMPDPGSRLLRRRETIRVPVPTQKQAAAAVLGPNATFDERPDRNLIDCCMMVTAETKPSKFVFRSGWERGDFFALVDLFPRHDPLNPLGILGITRWGAALASTTSAKGHSRENRIVVERLDDVRRVPPVPPETEVECFVDAPLATYAAASVTNYDETATRATRRFLFVKNRFLLVADELRLPADGRYRVSSVFNTQQAVAVPDATAALTWFDAPLCLDVPLRNPPVDLLVWFAPRSGFRLDILNRALEDDSTAAVPLQLRYGAELTGSADAPPARLAMLLRPQPPSAGDPSPSPAPGERQDAPGIEVLVDAPGSLAVLLRGPTGHEVAVINPAGAEIALPGTSTRARAAYFRHEDGVLREQWSHEAGADLPDAGR